MRRSLEPGASRCGRAARGGGSPGRWGLLLALALQACATAPEPAAFAADPATGVRVFTAPAPSAAERYCAWYGDAGPDGVLYFGQAAFWWAKAGAEGDPRGDLEHPGPQLVGRFDLEREALLPALRVDPPDASPPARSGVWDVLATDDGRLAYTTFFESAGWIDLASGAVTRLSWSAGLNELAPGPAGSILATRYGSGADHAGDGALLRIAPSGEVTRHVPLDGGEGFVLAPKTPAHDPLRRETWLTADWLPRGDGGGVRYDALRVDADGGVSVAPAPPELHFVAAGPDGALYRALVAGSRLSLRVTPPPGGPPERLVLLDDAFAAGLDFVQDLQPSADGRVAVTRWSGRVDVVHPDGRVGRIQLPRDDPAGLYYTAVLHGERICATYCADVTVVCADAP